MAGGLNSNTEQAQTHASQLKQGDSPAALNGVEEDNTLAERGVLSSYEKLADSYLSLMESIRATGSDIEEAAFLYEARDADCVKQFMGSEGA